MENELNILRKLIGLPEQVAEEVVNEEKCEECGMDPCTCDHVNESEVEEGNEFSGALAKAKAEGKDEFEVDGKKYKVNECGEMPMMSPMSAVGDTDAMAAVIAPDMAEPEAMMPQEEPEEKASYTLSIRNGDSTLNITTDDPSEITHIMKLAGVKGDVEVKKVEPEQQVEEEYANTPAVTGEKEPREFGDIRDWGFKGTGKGKPEYKGTKASGDNPLSEESLIGEYKSFKL